MRGEGSFTVMMVCVGRARSTINPWVGLVFPLADGDLPMPALERLPAVARGLQAGS